jgi:hypothetical protein
MLGDQLPERPGEPVQQAVRRPVAQAGPPSIAIAPAAEPRRDPMIQVERQGVGHCDEGDAKQVGHRPARRHRLVDQQALDLRISEGVGGVTEDHLGEPSDHLDRPAQRREAVQPAQPLVVAGQPPGREVGRADGDEAQPRRSDHGLDLGDLEHRDAMSPPLEGAHPVDVARGGRPEDTDMGHDSFSGRSRMRGHWRSAGRRPQPRVIGGRISSVERICPGDREGERSRPPGGHRLRREDGMIDGEGGHARGARMGALGACLGKRYQEALACSKMSTHSR